MEVAQARPGYELWRPNRAKRESQLMKSVVALVLFASAGVIFLITIGGWSRLQGFSVGIMALLWAGLYVLFGVLVSRWNRGVLPVAAALGVLMLIFASLAAPGWFDRTGSGFSSPALPEELLGLLTVILIPLSLILIAVSLIAFNQEWTVEEERPIGGGTGQHGTTGADDAGEQLPEPA